MTATPATQESTAQTALSMPLSSPPATPVLVLEGPQGRRIVWLERDLYSVGRESGCDVVVDHDSVSPRHGIIQRGSGGFEILDLVSTLGTRVNGARVEARQLDSGDEIHFGDIEALFLHPDAEVLPPGYQLFFLENSPPVAPGTVPHAATAGLPANLTHAEEDFTDLLVKSLGQTPWLLLSALLHGAILFLLYSFADKPVPEDPLPELTMEFSDLSAEDMVPDLEPKEEDVEITEDEYVEETIVEEFSLEDDSVDEAPSDIGEDMGPPIDGPFASGLSDLGSGIGSDRDDDDGGGRIGSAVRRLRASGLDIVFLVDATGSMDSEIDAAKRRIGEMIALLEAQGIAFRIGIIKFRDHTDDFVAVSSPLTANRFKAVHFLDDIEAFGGGDTPEAVYDAFLAANKLPWSSHAQKTMILVGDAPPHEDKTTKTLKLAASFAKRNGAVHTVFTKTELAGLDLSDARDAFRKIATAGGGRALELDDHRRLIEDILCLAFETTDRDAVRARIDEVRSGWRGRLVRERIRKPDVAWIEKELSRKTVRPVVSLELMRRNHLTMAPAYLSVLRDRAIPLRNRWMATVLLRRLVRSLERRGRAIPYEAQVAMESFHPELGRTRQTNALRRIGKALLDVGLLEEKKR